MNIENIWAEYHLLRFGNEYNVLRETLMTRKQKLEIEALEMLKEIRD